MNDGNVSLGGHDDGTSPEEPSRFAAYRARLRHGLAEDRSATLLELALQASLGYVVVGTLYTVLHIELMDLLESALSSQFTVFADYAALAAMIGLWPLLWGTSLVCGVAGCGVL